MNEIPEFIEVLTDNRFSGEDSVHISFWIKHTGVFEHIAQLIPFKSHVGGTIPDFATIQQVYQFLIITGRPTCGHTAESGHLAVDEARL